ncbi:hypothetical protein C8R44DRAFT_744410 [Mycena epipterygia]|nr:hypothetical protein C8R44DRAFT_744410 [Mycena epipterygia]
MANSWQIMIILPPVWNTITAGPAAGDGPGGVYGYGVPLCNNPPRRKKEWDRQRHPQIHVWAPFYWQVPERKKLENILHQYYTSMPGAVRHHAHIAAELTGNSLKGIIDQSIDQRINGGISEAVAQSNHTPRACAVQRFPYKNNLVNCWQPSILLRGTLSLIFPGTASIIGYSAILNNPRLSWIFYRPVLIDSPGHF